MTKAEKFETGDKGSKRSMSDIEAQETFQYRKVAAQERYRIYENPGRCWLYAYLAPLLVLIGGYIWWRLGHEWIHQHIWRNDIAYGVFTLIVAASTASGFGIASLSRAEFHADRAFQPLVCGCLTLLFLLVWWKTC